MLLKGEALISTVTLNSAIHGEKNNWTVEIKGPGNLATECKTQEAAPYELFDEMLNDMFAAVCDKIPGRVPLSARARR
jgi:hypothetical protein